jgi:hypothetical protein
MLLPLAEGRNSPRPQHPCRRHFRLYLCVQTSSKWKLEKTQGDFMIALFKTIRRVFLPALILVGSSPFVFTHWIPCLGFAPMGFTLLDSSASSHPGTSPEGASHHKVSWKAEDNTARVQKVFIQRESSRIGEPLATLSGQIQTPSCLNLFSRAPAILCILRI